MKGGWLDNLFLKSLSDCPRPYLLKLRHPTDPRIGSASWLCYQGIAFYGLFHHVQKWYANTFVFSLANQSLLMAITAFAVKSKPVFSLRR